MNYETIELKTERLVINKGDKNDFLKVYEYNFNKLQDVDGIFKLESNDLSNMEELFKGGMKKYYSNIKKAHMFDWIIYLNDLPIGNILTNEEDSDKKIIEVTSNIHPNYWGNGYMKEALTIVIEYLYSMGYENIVCGYLDGNIKAKKVLDKLGFKPYEILQDVYESEKGNKIDLYKTIMTKEDWFSKTGRIPLIKNSN